MKHVKSILARYRSLPTIDVSPPNLDAEHGMIRAFLYYLVPTWMGAGLFDWWWHKKTDIEHTSGTKESLIHAAMFSEVGIPLLMGIFAKINAGALATMWGAAFGHELTAIWDVDFAAHHREVAPREQHTHSFLEIIPFTACAVASCLHWDQLRALIGLGREKPDWRLQMKDRKIPDRYLPVMAGMVAGIALIYGNELYRCHKARHERHYNTGFYPPQR